MTPEEIDELFDAVRYDDDEYLWDYSGMEYTFSYANLEKYGEEFKKKLGQKIEQGNFEYFLTKKNACSSDKAIFVYLLTYTSNIEEMKRCVETSRELELSTGSIKNLIERINNQEYTKKCINNREKLDLDSYDVKELIISINDSKYIQECIANREKIGLSLRDVQSLIESINDQEYIKDYIDNRRKEFNLAPANIRKMIIKIKDPEYIKNCIDNRRDELGLGRRTIINLLKNINDPIYIKNCINNRREELNFDSSCIKNCIDIIDNIEYTKYCIDNRERLGLNTTDVIKLIKEINDPDYTKYCISQGEKIGIGDSELRILKSIYEQDYLNTMLRDTIKAKLDLPPEMTIGIEIESIGRNVELLNRFNKQLLGNWTCKDDGSLYSNISEEDGIEVISPILKGSNEKTTKEIARVCTILNIFGNYTNETCGGHIHIGADYLTNVNAWQNLLELWTNTEQILYIIGNEKGSIPRREVTDYASPISGDLEQALNSGSINLDSQMGLSKFKKELLKHQGYCDFDRYKGINFQNIKRSKKKTIEFRLPNGTVNAETWIQNINLFGGIVKTAQELSIIQSKEESKISEEEKKKLICFESIKSDDLSEKEKLEALLELVIEESSRGIYTERYEVNNKLLEENPDIQEEIREQISRKPIKISKKEIGKTVFKGSDRIINSEAKLVEQEINRYMENENEMNK